jgi:hypothetical protein
MWPSHSENQVLRGEQRIIATSPRHSSTCFAPCSRAFVVVLEESIPLSVSSGRKYALVYDSCGSEETLWATLLDVLSLISAVAGFTAMRKCAVHWS